MTAEDNYDAYVDALEKSNLDADVVEASIEALGFTQAFHDFMKDWNMIPITSNTVDVKVLEESFEKFVGEFQAACLILTSIKNSEKAILETHAKLKADSSSDVPSLVIDGYEKLAARVVSTRQTLMSL